MFGGEPRASSRYTWGQPKGEVKSIHPHERQKCPGRKIPPEQVEAGLRGFLAGLFWGGIVSAVGLGVVSELAPLPANQDKAPVAEAATAEVPSAEPVTAPESPAPESPAAEVAAPATPEPAAPAAPDATPPATPTAEPAPAAPEASPTPTEPTPTDPAPAEPAPAEPAPVEPAPVEPAPQATPPKSVPTAPAAVTAPAGLPPGPATTPEAEPAPQPSAPVAPISGEGADAAPAPVEAPPAPPSPAPPSPEPASAEPQAPAAPAPDQAAVADADAPLPGEVPAHSPLAPVPEPDAPAPVVEPAAPAEPLLDRPEPGLEGEVEGVTTNRLPRIEAEAPATPEAAKAAPADPRPVVRYAAAFDNPQAKPLFSILLIDDGQAKIDRAALAALELPITIALDPAAPDAEYLAELYRRGGKEVAMLATQIPEGAAPSDLQVTLDAHAKVLAQSVAVVDLPEGGFQNNRQIAADLVPFIKDQGRGLVTFDKGLNAGDQVAKREAVPSALIFREIDAEGEDTAAMRRHLDRAAFKAAQDGRVAVLGRAQPDTIAALLEWSIEGRAGSVALAPLTAVLVTPE